MEQNKQQEIKTHKIGIYLWIWGLLFVFSGFSYMVDKAGLIMAIFMHLFWERPPLVNVLLWPMCAIFCFVGIMVAEAKYTAFTRLFYFILGS